MYTEKQTRQRSRFSPLQEMQQECEVHQHIIKYTDSIKQSHLFSSSLQTHLPKCTSFAGRTQYMEFGALSLGIVCTWKKGRDIQQLLRGKKKRAVKPLLV